MGKRICPLCFVRVTWAALLTHSYEIRCTACHAPLELSRFTRMVGAMTGIAGAFAAAQAAAKIWLGGSWVTPQVAAIVGFAVASAAGVLLTGDLVVRPKVPPAAFPHPAE